MRISLKLTAAIVLFAISMSIAHAANRPYDFKKKNMQGVVLYYKIVSDSTVEITYKKVKDQHVQNDNYSGALIIPQSVVYKKRNYIVSQIGDYAFNLCKELVSISIPNSVTYIGDHAFANCLKLKDAKLPDNLEKIGDAAFGNTCISSVNIPSSVIAIGRLAFAYTNIKTLFIPGSIETIEEKAFMNCTKLTTVNLHYFVNRIDSKAFSGCRVLETVNITNLNAVIADDAFEGTIYEERIKRERLAEEDRIRRQKWQEMERITKEKKTKNDFLSGEGEIEVDGLKYSLNKGKTGVGVVGRTKAKDTGALIIPESVTIFGNSYPITYIGPYAFENSNISSVKFPQSLCYIHERAFRSCKNLTSLTITHLDGMANEAFARCSNIQTINVPNGINYAHDQFDGVPGYAKMVAEQRKTNENKLIAQYSKKYNVNILRQIVSIYHKQQRCEDAHWEMPIGAPLEFLRAYCSNFNVYIGILHASHGKDFFWNNPSQESNYQGHRSVVFVEEMPLSTTKRSYRFVNGKLISKNSW